jgi:uncharacterized sulfatase
MDWFRFLQLSIRYDLSTLFSINLIWFWILVFPVRYPERFFIWVKWAFISFNTIFLALNAADIGFFAFNTRRLSYPALRFLLDDSLRQLPQLMLHYWPIPLGIGLGVWLLSRSFSKPPASQSNGILVALGWIFLVPGIGIAMIRNSFQLKPLLAGEAFTLSRPEAGHAILNTPFVLFKTFGSPEIPAETWLTEARSNAILKQGSEPGKSPMAGANLVLIILESFSSEYSGLERKGVSYTPFLDSLAGEGIWFPHHFAGGRTSRDALPSILASIPAWMDESFVTSPYVSARFAGLGQALKEEGYQTAFFHGGKNGTMSFDVFSRMAGFDHYFGMNEYPKPADYDGNWGIFDGPFLQFTGTNLSKMKPPFAAVIFTLSSHQPYTIPKEEEGKLPKGPLPVHQAVAYADKSLAGFFKQIKQTTWFENTVFVLTADHTHANQDPAYANFYGDYDVPLIIFSPKELPQMDTSRWVQHPDIAPTLKDLLLRKPESGTRLGNSLLRSQSAWPVAFQNGAYHLMHPKGLLLWNGKEPGQGWVWSSQKGEPEPAGLREEMMARLQYFRLGIKFDKLLP